MREQPHDVAMKRMHSAAPTIERIHIKKSCLFSGVSTSMPIMFLEDLYSSRMYPGTQQVTDLKGKRFKRLGTFLSFWFFPQTVLTSAGVI